MARKLHMAFLVAFVIAALMQSSAAQTTHVVGNNSGWIIPPGGATFYPNWVANQVFSVGDILVFNFAATQHDVAKVTKADYDACTTTNPISMETASPARITINATGEHYFICNFTGHCSAGQKLMINVSAATSSPAPQPSSSSSPAPQPSTSTPTPAPQPSTPSPQPSATPAPTPTPVSAPSPSPVSTPTPTPSPVSAPSPSPVSTPTPSPASAPSPGTSAPGVTYTVGDSQGWTLLSNTAAFYQNWASGKNFMPGDILVFNYINGTHDVAELTQENYNSCTTNNPISLNSTPPTRITLTPGEHFYVCAIPGHCSAGQKLAINVTSSGTATPPSSTATPPSSTATPPSSTTPSNPIDPPPSDSSARSLSVAGLSATLLSIVVAFLY